VFDLYYPLNYFSYFHFQGVPLSCYFLFSFKDPNSPKLNGCVERANRTHREEFYELEEIELSLVEHNKQLSRWEHTYNYVRPHQGIDYLTPNEYYRNWLENRKTKGDNVSLTY